MKVSLAYYLKTRSSLDTEQGRRRAVDTVLQLAQHSLLTPKQYERTLLELFVLGRLSIEQVIARLEKREHE